MDHIVLGKRLRAARERCGLSQQVAAEHLGIPRTAVTLIEAGQRQVSTIELTKLAALYRKPVSDFFNSEDKSEDYLVVLHRGAPDMHNQPNVKMAVEKCLDICRIGVELETALGREIRSAPPNYEIGAPRNSGEAITQGEEIAEQERQRLGLGHAPIRNISARIAEQGIWAVAAELSSEMSGLFMSNPDIGMVVIANSDHRRSRRRFSFAHEYGHALMDRELGMQVSQVANSGDLIEKRANAFAAAFLLPPKGVENFLTSSGKGRASRLQQAIYDVASNGRLEVESRAAPNSQTITYQDVASLMLSYGVSYEAATYRLFNLGYIDWKETQDLLVQSGLGNRYLNLLRQSDPDNNVHAEASPDGPELRFQILRLAMEAFRREEISRGRLLEIGRRLDIAGQILVELADAQRSS